MAVVSNPSADADEKIERAARVLRLSPQYREVFKAIYGGQKQFKSMEEIKKLVSNFNSKTYKAARVLHHEDIIDRRIEGHEKYYGKNGFYMHNREKILRLVENPSRLKKYPTKRKSQIQIVSGSSYKFRSKPKVIQLYVDDIDSFKKVKRIKHADTGRIRRMPERTINKGICRILNQKDKKDWGGERHDIYTNKISISGSRKSAAFALKGKAVKSKLTPGKMGKNGDQILRLFEATADLYLIVHNREIDDRVVDMMQALALSKSVAIGKTIQFCVIDGDDLARLIVSYPKEFGISS